MSLSGLISSSDVDGQQRVCGPSRWALLKCLRQVAHRRNVVGKPGFFVVGFGSHVRTVRAGRNHASTADSKGPARHGY